MKSRTHFLTATIAILAALLALTIAPGRVRASVDIGPMTWTQRSDWVNVKNCTALTGVPSAKGDGVTDDTQAVQAALNYVQNNIVLYWQTANHPVTVYFPPGTYKISSTLTLSGTKYGSMEGVSLIGCGSQTVIKWASTAPIGSAMFAPNGTDEMRYLGLVWDGNSRASCGILLQTTPYLHDDGNTFANYQSQIRIENSSFRNFTQLGTYATPFNSHPLYGAGIAQGTQNDGNPIGESMVYNCRFSNCTIGVAFYLSCNGNNCECNVDGCEFDNCTYLGVYCQFAGGFMITNCHFQNTGGSDIFGQYETRVRHCTSQMSGMFYTEGDNNYNDPEIIEDCWVDGWKGWPMIIPNRTTIPAGPAVNFAGLGPNMVFDSTFTHPPASAQGVIYSYSTYGYYGTGTTPGLSLSNNTAPNFGSGTGLLWPRPGVPLYTNVIPSGLRGGLVSSASQTFLKTSYPADSRSIIDVTQAPYTADNTGRTDSTAAIQAAINAAAAANNGSVVYFPYGNYIVSSPLTATGGNYTLQGTGIRTSLNWNTANTNPLLTITNPQNITVQGLTIPSVLQTASGPSRATYDELFCFGQGLTLSNLPANSTVYLGHVNVSLTVSNCGAAQILSKYLQFNTINVSGTTPQTGFLGVMEGEGGQETAGVYNITIGDNQDFVMNDYYTEQEANGLDLERGQGTGFGRVSISGVNSEVKTHNPVTSLLINNYQGRLFYTSDLFGQDGPPGYPYSISETNPNPLDLIFLGNWFYDNGVQPFTPGPATTLIGALNNFDNGNGMSFQPTSTPGWFSSTDNAQSAYALASEAAGMDHFRQLETAEAAHQGGMVGYWKLDEATGNTSRDSTISGLDGTWINGPAFSAAQPSAIGLTDPGCMTFNGVNQYVSIPPSATLPSGKSPRSLCGWAKSNSLAGGWRWIAAYGSPNTSQAMFIGMNGTTLYGGGYGDDLSVPNFWDNNWHFIALTYDGIAARLYADGVMRASGAKNWNLVPGSCYLGEQVNNAPEYWNGLVDDVRIYNRALSAADISSLAGH